MTITFASLNSTFAKIKKGDRQKRSPLYLGKIIVVLVLPLRVNGMIKLTYLIF